MVDFARYAIDQYQASAQRIVEFERQLNAHGVEDFRPRFGPDGTGKYLNFPASAPEAFPEPTADR